MEDEGHSHSAHPDITQRTSSEASDKPHSLSYASSSASFCTKRNQVIAKITWRKKKSPTSEVSPGCSLDHGKRSFSFRIHCMAGLAVCSRNSCVQGNECDGCAPGAFIQQSKCCVTQLGHVERGKWSCFRPYTPSRPSYTWECICHISLIMQKSVPNVALQNWQYITRICTTFVDVFPSCLTAGLPWLEKIVVRDEGS